MINAVAEPNKMILYEYFQNISHIICKNAVFPRSLSLLSVLFSHKKVHKNKKKTERMNTQTTLTFGKLNPSRTKPNVSGKVNVRSNSPATIGVLQATLISGRFVLVTVPRWTVMWQFGDLFATVVVTVGWKASHKLTDSTLLRRRRQQQLLW